MKLLVLSDIHGNRAAFKTVLDYIKDVHIDCVALLGDLIDYCPHSNEVVEMISNMTIPIVCNIYGNHENAIINNDFSRFSSSRGVECAKITKSILTRESENYLVSQMTNDGKNDFYVDGKHILAVHGTIDDIYWGKFNCSNDLSAYADYEVVFMGHSHRPLYYEMYFNSDNQNTRFQKKTIFINPGSVGQPRNINPFSQFVVFDTCNENCEFVKLKYDYTEEQRDFSNNVDDFYKTRLQFGI